MNTTTFHEKKAFLIDSCSMHLLRLFVTNEFLFLGTKVNWEILHKSNFGFYLGLLCLKVSGDSVHLKETYITVFLNIDKFPRSKRFDVVSILSKILK